MKRTAMIVGLLAIAATAMSPSVAAAPIGSTPMWDVTTQGLISPARYYDVLQEIVEGEPGQDGPLRNGQAQYIITVLEGELTVLMGEKRSVYRKNQTAVIPAGINWWFGNEGTEKLRFHETILTPAWQNGPAKVIRPPAKVVTVTTAVQRGPFANFSKAPPLVDLTQQGASLSCGYASSKLTANAFNLVTVISGELTLRYEDGTLQKVAANQVTNLAIGKGVVIANEGPATATYFMSWLAAPGTPLLKN